MIKKKIFLASSCELAEDRQQLEKFVGRKNKDWIDRGVFLELVMWEDFLDAMSQTRLQGEYNKAVRECDVFVMLFSTKVGRYTEEEFNTAFGQFKATNKPFIFTYFKDAKIDTGSADRKELMSLLAFQEKLDSLGHFYTRYANIDQLVLHFSGQLDKLAANGFIEFPKDDESGSAASLRANLAGNGAIAQGDGATAVGAGGVVVGGSNSGTINTGTQVDTGGGAYVGGNVSAGRDFTGGNRIESHGMSAQDLPVLFAQLQAAVAEAAPADKQSEAVQQVEQLKAELAKGARADDSRIGKIVDGLTAMVPGAVGSVVSLFATPLLGGIAGPVTNYVLDKIKGN